MTLDPPQRRADPEAKEAEAEHEEEKTTVHEREDVNDHARTWAELERRHFQLNPIRSQRPQRPNPDTPPNSVGVSIVETSCFGRILISTIRLPDDGGEPNYETVKIHCHPTMQWSMSVSHDRGEDAAAAKHMRFFKETEEAHEANLNAKPKFWQRVKAHGLMENFEA